MTDVSAAVEQHPVGNPSVSYPLTPPLTTGPPETDREDLRPFEVRPGRHVTVRLRCRSRYRPLLPPLAGAPLGAGGTPLPELPGLADCAGVDGPVCLKDESQNPTWSHEDRLNSGPARSGRSVSRRGLSPAAGAASHR